MATSKDTKLNELVINETTEEILQSQEVQPNQLYITPDEDNTINFNEVKLSEFINDGNGSSPFATEDFVTKSGVNGLIDSISVNGQAQTIDENKNVDITIPTKLSEFKDDVITGKYLPLSGGKITGTVTFPAGASIDTNGYIVGSWLKTTSNIASNIPATKIAIIRDQWIYTRTPEEILSDISALSTKGGTVTGDLIVNGQTTLKNTTVGGDLTISGKIYVDGGVYTTLAEELKVEDDYIILRNGAQTGIGPTEYSGLEFHNYDGKNNDLRLVVGNDGVARVGDKEGTLQALATREDKPNANALAYWDSVTNSFKTDLALTKDTTGALVINKAGIGQGENNGHVILQKNGTDYGHLRLTAANSNLAIESKGGIILYAGETDNGTKFNSENYVGVYSGLLRANGTVDINNFRNLKLTGSILKGDYTYTLPSKTGTIALTSDIPSLTNYATKTDVSAIKTTADNALAKANEAFSPTNLPNQMQVEHSNEANIFYNNNSPSGNYAWLNYRGSGTQANTIKVGNGSATGGYGNVQAADFLFSDGSSVKTALGSLGSLATKSAITNDDISASAAIATSKLADKDNFVLRGAVQEITGLKTFKNSLKIGNATLSYNETVKALEISVQ